MGKMQLFQPSVLKSLDRLPAHLISQMFGELHVKIEITGKTKFFRRSHLHFWGEFLGPSRLGMLYNALTQTPSTSMFEELLIVDGLSEDVQRCFAAV
jgi:hypothetical protein